MQRRAHYPGWLLLMLLLLASCGSTAQEPTPAIQTTTEQGTTLSGEITFDGSTTMEPLVQRLADAFAAEHPTVSLTVRSSDSGAGVEAVQHGDVDIGMASRSLSEQEQQGGITVYPIAIDAVAIIVHPSNPVTDLTRQQLQDIFSGRTTTWSAAGGPDTAIVPVVREATSGTRATFDEVIMAGQAYDADAIMQFSTSLVEMEVASNAQAIGYVSLGHVKRDEVAVIAIDGVLPAAASTLDGAYPLQRPLLLFTGPLSRDVSGEFITFALSSEGQQVIADEGWIALQAGSAP